MSIADKLIQLRHITGEEMTVTTLGYLPRRCYTLQKQGDQLDEKSRALVRADGTIIDRHNCDLLQVDKIQGGSEKLSGGGELQDWIERGSAVYQVNMRKIATRWLVPKAPSSHEGIIFLFPGMQPAWKTPPIIQPVLMWGGNGIIGGEYWNIHSEYCTPSAGCLYSTPIKVYDNQTIYGSVEGKSCSRSGCDWWINTQNLSKPSDITTLRTSTAGHMRWMLGGVLEVYGITSCNGLPATNTNFNYIELRRMDNVRVGATWDEVMDQRTGCSGQSVDSDIDTVWLNY